MPRYSREGEPPAFRFCGLLFWRHIAIVYSVSAAFDVGPSGVPSIRNDVRQAERKSMVRFEAVRPRPSTANDGANDGEGGLPFVLEANRRIWNLGFVGD